ncbi:MAG: AAA-associated domain-containing protein [Candidatus Micrarchaeaceae archaeon]
MEFPINQSIGRVIGLFREIKKHGGKLALYELSRETGEDIDTLLPTIKAAEVLGIIRKKEGSIYAEDIDEDPYPLIKKKIEMLEPFKTVLESLSSGSKSTSELFEEISNKNLSISKEKEGIKELRRMLMNWGVRLKILKYDKEKDSWSLN